MLTCSYNSVYVYSKPFRMYSGLPFACDMGISCFRYLQIQTKTKILPEPRFPLCYCTPNPDTCSDGGNRGISEHKLHVSINQQHTVHCLHGGTVLLTMLLLPDMLSTKRKSYLVNRTNLVHNFFLNMFIAFLYMFRETMCPSSGENTVPMRHLVLVTLYTQMTVRYAGRNSLRPA